MTLTNFLMMFALFVPFAPKWAALCATKFGLKSHKHTTEEPDRKSVDGVEMSETHDVIAFQTNPLFTASSKAAAEEEPGLPTPGN